MPHAASQRLPGARFELSDCRRYVFVHSDDPAVAPEHFTAADFVATYEAAAPIVAEIRSAGRNVVALGGARPTRPRARPHPQPATAPGGIPIVWLDAAPPVDIDDGIAAATIRSGDFALQLRFKVRVLVQAVANANRAYARHLARQAASVLALRKPS